MMMKKTTSALAVAALLGTGAASAATFQVNDDTTVSVGGDFFFAYYDKNDVNGESSDTIIDNASSLVFSGETAHDNGITTDFNLDLDGFNTITNGANDSITTDEASIGFSGSFGEIRVGSEGSAFGPVDINDVAWGSGVFNYGAVDDRLISYRSNDLDGLTYRIDAQFNGDNQGKNSSTNFAGNVVYDLGGLTLAAAYDEQAAGDDEPLYGLAATTTVAGVNVGLAFQQDGGATEASESEVLAVTANYNYGSGYVYGVAQSVEFGAAPLKDSLSSWQDGSGTTAGVDASADIDDTDLNGSETEDSFTQVMVGAVYSITSNSEVLVEYTQLDLDNDRGDEVVLGMNFYW